MRKLITSEKAGPPQAIYSPAIAASGTLLFLAGQVPVDPTTGNLKLGSFEQQARLAFDNVTALLEAGGVSWANVVRVGVFLADLGDFAQMNQIYKDYVIEPYPARTTVQAGLPPNVLIEVDCIAVIPEESA